MGPNFKHLELGAREVGSREKYNRVRQGELVLNFFFFFCGSRSHVFVSKLRIFILGEAGTHEVA